MSLNPKHPFINRRRSEILEEELQDLTDVEYEEYLLWGINNNLKYLVAEGLVESETCPVTGELIYRLASVVSEQN